MVSINFYPLISNTEIVGSQSLDMVKRVIRVFLLPLKLSLYPLLDDLRVYSTMSRLGRGPLKFGALGLFKALR